MGSEGSSTRAVVASLLGNAAVAVLKFVVGFLSGSSAMVSEAIHSSVDTGNQALFLVGLSRGRRPPDAAHPFGHGKEVYFWGLIVAVSIFGVGGGLSIYGGIVHLGDAHPPALRWNLLVLACATVFEGIAFGVAYREFKLGAHTRGQSAWRMFREGKDPSLYTAVVENSLDLAGLAVAALAILLANLLEAPLLDAVGSIIIGAMLASAALLLMWEARGLIVGEGVSLEVAQALRQIALEDPCVQRSQLPLTMYLGPDQILVAFELEFRPGTTADKIADSVGRIEEAVKSRYPRVHEVLIEAASLGGSHARSEERGLAS